MGRVWWSSLRCESLAPDASGKSWRGCPEIELKVLKHFSQEEYWKRYLCTGFLGICIVIYKNVYKSFKNYIHF